MEVVRPRLGQKIVVATQSTLLQEPRIARFPTDQTPNET